MDVLPYITTGVSLLALLVASAALTIAVKTRRLHALTPAIGTNRKQEVYSEIANTLSDGAMLWQRLAIQCDELSTHLISSRLSGAPREAVGDWLATLREFSKKSKSEIDHAYQLFSAEAKKMTVDDLELQIPDMARFDKEMKGNMTVIADQIDHIDGVLSGTTALSNRQLKITLQKPQAMPHFLRKRLKIAELQRRRSQPVSAV
ncbi:MAG: hypothetical protein ACI82A_000859 [Candidatus Azotimanducaceae bacterium]|jgi:hypothetical protein